LENKLSIRKTFSLLGLVICLYGCSDRPEEFLGGFSEYEIVELHDNNYTPKNSYSYALGHSYSSTEDAIEGISKIVSSSDSTKATANVFHVANSNKKQCVIVHRENMSQLTLNHELGHCFHPILFSHLEIKAPTILKGIEDDKKWSDYYLESFAEIVAGTRSFSLDGDKSYIIKRIQEIESSSDSEKMLPYKRSIPLLKHLSDFLDSADLPASPEEQVNLILEKIYFEPKFNKVLQRVNR
jgi:hypothetical protein